MKNVFSWDNGKKILAFTDRKGTVAGDLMKQIKFRAPDSIDNLKEKINAGVKAGDYFFIDHYAFVVLKNGYRAKSNLKEIETMLENLPTELKNMDIKTTFEDYKEVKLLVEKTFKNLEVCDTSKWEVGKK